MAQTAALNPAAKARLLASYAGGATPEEIERIIAGAWKLRDLPDLREFYWD